MELNPLPPRVSLKLTCYPNYMRNCSNAGPVSQAMVQYPASACRVSVWDNNTIYIAANPTPVDVDDDANACVSTMYTHRIITTHLL